MEKMCVRAGAALALATSAVAVPAVAWADGPGYGGTADQLQITWVTSSSSEASAHVGAASSNDVISTNAEEMKISGGGFRGESFVNIQIGSTKIQTRRSDMSGTLDMVVRSTPDDQPGMSVVAIGTSPGGTRRTLVGAIPPKPSGVGPGQIVPWLGLATICGAVGTYVWRRGRPTKVG